VNERGLIGIKFYSSMLSEKKFSQDFIASANHTNEQAQTAHPCGMRPEKERKSTGEKITHR
jgi:hypothetical protein